MENGGRKGERGDRSEEQSREIFSEYCKNARREAPKREEIRNWKNRLPSKWMSELVAAMKEWKKVEKY